MRRINKMEEKNRTPRFGENVKCWNYGRGNLK